MSTQLQPITDAPVDIAAELSLTAGTYRLQNVGLSELYVNFQDAALVDPSTLTEGEILGRRERLTHTLAAGGAIYVWAVPDNGRENGRLAVT